PEIAIFGDISTETSLEPGTIGYITVRGEPLFSGYEGDGDANKSSFTLNGWFNTGDMGFLDDDGYLLKISTDVLSIVPSTIPASLYPLITGRSKEVINHGGEIISPVEIEDAVLGHPPVRTSLAFVVPHDVLQESIGVAIVSEPHAKRVDLLELHNFLSHTLHPSKCPQVMVYWDDVQKNMGNKRLRINLAQRFGIPELRDGLPPSSRTYEATCPPPTASIKEPIPAALVVPSAEASLTVLLSHPSVVDAVIVPKALNAFMKLRGPDADAEYESPAIADDVSRAVHNYDRPREFIVIDAIPRLDDGSTDNPALTLKARPAEVEAGPVERAVATIFRNVLGINGTDYVWKDMDFFEMGGDSLKPGRMAGVRRKTLGVAVRAQDNPDVQKGHSEKLNQIPRAPLAAADEARAVAIAVQAIPLVLLRPMRRLGGWLLFANILCFIKIVLGWKANDTGSRLLQLIIAVTAAGILFSGIFLPLFAWATKWIVIGHYRAGSHPLWGSYNLRWWIVDRVLFMCGRGLFELNSTTLTLYLRLMGAKIRVRYVDSGTMFGEFDLIDIGEGCAFEAARVRAFTMEGGCMVLSKIVICSRFVMNIRTIIVPGAYVPPNTAFPPISSSHEIADTRPHYATLCRSTLPSPSIFTKIFLGYPLIGFVHIVSLLPWLGNMYLLSREDEKKDEGGWGGKRRRRQDAKRWGAKTTVFASRGREAASSIGVRSRVQCCVISSTLDRPSACFAEMRQSLLYCDKMLGQSLPWTGEREKNDITN
ncbi:hypothetical protein BDK51DRAFT_28132, partial [Blyttiomyces helicus]